MASSANSTIYALNFWGSLQSFRFSVGRDLGGNRAQRQLCNLMPIFFPVEQSWFYLPVHLISISAAKLSDLSCFVCLFVFCSFFLCHLPWLSASDSENQKCLRLDGLENGRVLIFYSFCACVSKTTQSVSFFERLGKVFCTFWESTQCWLSKWKKRLTAHYRLNWIFSIKHVKT